MNAAETKSAAQDIADPNATRPLDEPTPVGESPVQPRGVAPDRRKIVVLPITLPKANLFIERHHRHHGKMPGGFAWFCVGAWVDGHLVGVALAGRPTNRNNDDGQTVEVMRLASDGTDNVCSCLYGACARAAQAIGAARIITYTLASESGSSLRGVGWVRESEGIKSWWTHEGVRKGAIDRPHMNESKVRWGRTFRTPVSVLDVEYGGAKVIK